MGFGAVFMSWIHPFWGQKKDASSCRPETCPKSVTGRVAWCAMYEVCESTGCSLLPIPYPFGGRILAITKSGIRHHWKPDECALPWKATRCLGSLKISNILATWHRHCRCSAWDGSVLSGSWFVIAVGALGKFKRTLVKNPFVSILGDPKKCWVSTWFILGTCYLGCVPKVTKAVAAETYTIFYQSRQSAAA
jgi:hypothetical protein